MKNKHSFTIVKLNGPDENKLAELRKLSIETFSKTYAHLNTPSNFKKYLDEAFNSQRLESEVNNPESVFYLIYHQQDAVAYLKLNTGNAQTEKRSRDWVEIERIYVHHEFKGMGLGAKMVGLAKVFAKNAGIDKIWLGVWDANKTAVAFYQQMGFVIADNHIFQLGDEAQNDYIMEKII